MRHRTVLRARLLYERCSEVDSISLSCSLLECALFTEKAFFEEAGLAPERRLTHSRGSGPVGRQHFPLSHRRHRLKEQRLLLQCSSNWRSNGAEAKPPAPGATNLGQVRSCNATQQRLCGEGATPRPPPCVFSGHAAQSGGRDLERLDVSSPVGTSMVGCRRNVLGAALLQGRE